MQHFNVTFFPSSLTTFPRGNSKPKRTEKKTKTELCRSNKKQRSHTCSETFKQQQVAKSYVRDIENTFRFCSHNAAE
jgi:hypothetical protein